MAHAILRRALKDALQLNMIVRNPCDAVTKPRVEKREITPLSQEQAQSLFAAAADDRLRAIYFVAVDTGLRSGELFALQWSDVDLESRKLTVRRTLVELPRELILGKPKTKTGQRSVDLSVSVEALHEHRKRMMAEGHAAVPWVFCNTVGEPLRRSGFRRQSFKPLLKRAGLPDIRFHDLRHTSASLLLAAGVHPKVVQERLGHSQIAVTMDTYSHLLPTMGREAALKMGAMLTPKRAKAAARA